MYKSLVFFDLDGTLLNDESVITEEVEIALRSIKDNGHLPIIATGRPYSQIYNILENTIIDSYILLNGQTIIVEGKTIFSSNFSDHLMHNFIDTANENDIPLAFYGANKHVISQHTTIVEEALEYFNIPLPDEDEKYYEENDVMMMLLFTDNLDHDVLFEKKFPELNFYRTSPYSIDVIHAENSKATSIEKLKKHMGYEDLPTYAFGDSVNDLGMIKEADYSVVMGNGVEELKEIADVIVSSNNETGIIDGLKYYNLL